MVKEEPEYTVDDTLSKAEMIADLIAKTDTDDHGVLLSYVATILFNRSQNYTATLIYKAAVEYGLPDISNKEFTG